MTHTLWRHVPHQHACRQHGNTGACMVVRCTAVATHKHASHARKCSPRSRTRRGAGCLVPGIRFFSPRLLFWVHLLALLAPAGFTPGPPLAPTWCRSFVNTALPLRLSSLLGCIRLMVFSDLPRSPQSCCRPGSGCLPSPLHVVSSAGLFPIMQVPSCAQHDDNFRAAIRWLPPHVLDFPS